MQHSIISPYKSDTSMEIINLIFLHKYVLTKPWHGQINENPCSNYEVHILFEYFFLLDNT